MLTKIHSVSIFNLVKRIDIYSICATCYNVGEVYFIHTES
jgi:hypothetical protein